MEETAPLGPVPQGAYLNQMLLVETGLGPEALLSALLELERAEGRVRAARWGPRTLDCDIVLWEGLAVSTPILTVPHPEAGRRDFWLRELAALGITPGEGGW